MTADRQEQLSRLKVFSRHGGLCLHCGRRINGIDEAWTIAKAEPGLNDDGLRPAHVFCGEVQRRDGEEVPFKAPAVPFQGGRVKGQRTMPLGRKSPWKRKVDGTIVKRD